MGIGQGARALACGAIIAAFACGTAAATTFDVTQQRKGDVFGGAATRDIWFDYDGKRIGARAGRFALFGGEASDPDAFGAFYAWCVDLDTRLKVGGKGSPYSVSDTLLTAGQQDSVARLFAKGYATLDARDGAQMAGFQLALWEARYDGDGALSLAEGRIQSGAKNGGATAFAAALLEDLRETPAAGYAITYLASGVNPGGRQISQHLVTGTRRVGSAPPPAAIPLPVSAWMLLVGLAALGVVGLRGTRRAGGA